MRSLLVLLGRLLTLCSSCVLAGYWEDPFLCLFHKGRPRRREPLLHRGEHALHWLLRGAEQAA